jgi:hypothetical protein
MAHHRADPPEVDRRGGDGVIRIRLVAGDVDVDELHAAAAAIAQALTVTHASRPVPRRSADGVSLYLDAELPTTAATQRANP